MKKFLFVVVCCLCLCGCSEDKTTICKYNNEELLNNKHIITIKHSDNKIIYYKNEYETDYSTIAEAIEEEQQQKKNLICSENNCYSSLEGENGWKYIVKRDGKTVYLTQETNNYDKNYVEEIKYLESLSSYTCFEK